MWPGKGNRRSDREKRRQTGQRERKERKGHRDRQKDSIEAGEGETGERDVHRDAQKREPGEAEKQQEPDDQAARGGSIHRGKKGPS